MPQPYGYSTENSEEPIYYIGPFAFRILPSDFCLLPWRYLFGVLLKNPAERYG
jgi:hypothetical protein